MAEFDRLGGGSKWIVLEFVERERTAQQLIGHSEADFDRRTKSYNWLRANELVDRWCEGVNRNKRGYLQFEITARARAALFNEPLRLYMSRRFLDGIRTSARFVA